MPSSPVLDALVAELAGRLQGGTRAGDASGVPNTPYYTGPGGLFGVQGLERDLLSTRVHPNGMISMLPAVPTNRMYPLFGYLTGIQASSGAAPNGVCDDTFVAGPGKSCLQTAQFGRYSFETREFEVNRLGQQIDRGEFQDIRILNDPLLQSMGSILPNLPANPSLGREVLMRFMEVGVSYQNQLGRQVYTANPSNNTAGGGYAEFPGADILIGTNKFDALTGAACPSLDSTILNFSYKHVDDLTGLGADIVETLVGMFRHLRRNADGMNLSPVNWVMSMRRSLFWEITAVWPCAYLTARCAFKAVDGTMQVNVDAGDQIAMRDSMRNGSYLLIDGQQVPIVIDDFIVEETNTTQALVDNPCFASDIYIWPMTIMGGMAATYLEYFNYSDGPMQGVADGRLGGEFWTDGGRYLWHPKTPANWCVAWISKIEPRLILRTPQLAGRIQNVQYCPFLHERDAVIGDPYDVDGGVSVPRAGSSLWSDWNTP